MTFSFEFFPPKKQAAEEALWREAGLLAEAGPEFMTVTYGAGGSTRDKTFETVQAMQNRFGYPVAAHLTFIHATKDELNATVDELWQSGIRHIVALRGDMPDDLAWPLDRDQDYFQYTSDFVEGVLARHPFEVSVAAYPEKHPDSKTLGDDIYALKMKFDAGAHRAITQFFFENHVYYDFLDKCAQQNITQPICPGLLPIHDFASAVKFAGKCQANVPDSIKDKFEHFKDSPEDTLKLAEELLTEQTADLIQNGAPHIHFYTLNKAELTLPACLAIKQNPTQKRSIQ